MIGVTNALSQGELDQFRASLGHWDENQETTNADVAFAFFEFARFDLWLKS